MRSLGLLDRRQPPQGESDWCPWSSYLFWARPQASYLPQTGPQKVSQRLGQRCPIFDQVIIKKLI